MSVVSYLAIICYSLQTSLLLRCYRIRNVLNKSLLLLKICYHLTISSQNKADGMKNNITTKGSSSSANDIDK